MVLLLNDLPLHGSTCFQGCGARGRISRLVLEGQNNTALSFYQTPTGAIRAAIVTGDPKLNIDNNTLQDMIQLGLHLYWLLELRVCICKMITT